MMKHRVVIGLGSNLAEGKTLIAQCVDRLGALISFDSPLWIYSTPSISGKGPDYYNCVMSGVTSLECLELNVRSKEIEIAMGRTDECKLTGAVPIDIDIVMFDGEIMRPRDFSQPYFTIGYERLPHCAGATGQPL